MLYKEKSFRYLTTPAGSFELPPFQAQNYPVTISLPFQGSWVGLGETSKTLSSKHY